MGQGDELMTRNVTYCFACKKPFESIGALKLHMETCKAAAESLNVKPLKEAVKDVMDALDKLEEKE